MSAHGHDHNHGPHGHDHPHHDFGHAHAHAAPGDWRYGVGLLVNLLYVAVEFGFGVITGSTALLADAGHNLSDVLGLAMAGGAAWLARQAPGARRTYGFGKATILAALANGVLLVFACGAIAVEAVRRLAEPAEAASVTIMVVAGIGFLINLGTALLFLDSRRHDLNARGAFLHMAADAAISAGVVLAGGLILLTGQTWIDPIVGLVIVAVILVGTWGLLRDSLDLALDAAPAGLDLDEVRGYLEGLPGVSAAHDLHVWNLSTTETALTVHLVRDTPADAAFLADAQTGLRVRFGIGHATLQVEPAPQPGCPTC